MINQISKICQNKSILKIGQNIKYDIRILNKYGVIFNSIADTMLISYSIDNGIYKHNLDDLSYNHLNHSTIKYKDVVGTGKMKQLLTKSKWMMLSTMQLKIHCLLIDFFKFLSSSN